MLGETLFSIQFLVLLTIALPLLSSIIIGSFLRMPRILAYLISCGCVGLAAIFANYIFIDLVINGNNQVIHLELWQWFNFQDLSAKFGIYVDVLSAIMLVVVLNVSALVHIFSIGYMSEDKSVQRFMSYLSLFTFFMLTLIISDNFIQLFFGWEGVGLSSYLLIGFWFERPSANAAAIKAFLVNRVGDIGLAIAIFSIAIVFNSVGFLEVFDKTPLHLNDKFNILGHEYSAIVWICSFLFIGCMGKSAQLGLHVWLPDAMEGPTPVSALIHAATMVTAGVFLVARCSPLFEHAKPVLDVMVVIGALTCLFGASVALVQDDIKKVIAYSTCSQLGYMFFACGVSAYAAAIFHLFTHAFFKALLFLGAGSVIHALNGEQDLKKMGGIYRKIPFTYSVMLIGSLALAGVFPFAGFFSKDIILESAFAAGNNLGIIAYVVGVLVASMTAFYSWKLIIMAFNGKTRLDRHTISHIHEAPLSMKIPLIILSIGAIFSGIFGERIGMLEGVDFWRSSIFVLADHNAINDAHNVPNIIAIMPSIAGGLGIFLAYLLFMYRENWVKKITITIYRLRNVLIKKFYFDELYGCLVNLTKSLSKFLSIKMDKNFIDGIPNGLALITKRVSNFASCLHTGYVYHYALAMVLGVIVMLCMFYIV